MVDGKNTTLTKSQRLQKLRQHDAAWSSLNWTECIQRTITTPPGYVTRGTLRIGCPLVHWLESLPSTASNAPQTRLVFYRIPSACRGIESATWTIEFSFKLSAFSCDPSQNLLIVIEQDPTPESVIAGA